ncbi:hypothetical protein HNP84_005048 [Thermocatellispora tengchongensis]|uniref:Terpene synthase n=1 Tax=Thermocatellispora tengchongensis TaxID=1073253 RepID=A0A840P7N1_9ACTN|nr:hypothetical protein [Thermocatellispora tengchongensis]MBB5135312.1 hypothetical protein [Thermocatellispora tengchongensis]
MPADVKFEIPLPLRLNEGWREAAERNLDWLARRHLISEGTAGLYNLFKSERLVGYTFPYASPHGLDMANRIVSVCTLLDDQFDGPAGRDPVSARAISASFERLLEDADGAEDGEAAGRSPLHQAFAEMWRDSCAGKSAAWRARASESWRRYFGSLVHESGNRRRGEFLPLDCYLEQRLVTGAMQQFTDACEVAGEFEVPWVAFNIPHVRIMRTLTADFVNLANDLASLEKELAAGETDNLVMVIRNERNCTLEEAIEHAYHFVAGKVERFVELREEVPEVVAALELPEEDVAVLYRYLDALAAWIVGYERWQRETFRYRKADAVDRATGAGYRLDDLLSVS